MHKFDWYELIVFECLGPRVVVFGLCSWSRDYRIFSFAGPSFVWAGLFLVEIMELHTIANSKYSYSIDDWIFRTVWSMHYGRMIISQLLISQCMDLFKHPWLMSRQSCKRGGPVWDDNHLSLSSAVMMCLDHSKKSKQMLPADAQVNGVSSIKLLHSLMACCWACWGSLGLLIVDRILWIPDLVTSLSCSTGTPRLQRRPLK